MKDPTPAHRSLLPAFLCILAGFALLLPGCTSEELWGEPRIKTVVTTPTGTQNLRLPSVFHLHMLMPVSQTFPAVDTVVEPLVPAPVNVNTASDEVLTAIFANVRRSAQLRVNHRRG